MEKHATYKGKSVEVLARNGGWTTILLDSGSTRKVRNGEISPIRAPKATPTARAIKPATREAKTIKPATSAPGDEATDKAREPLVSADLSHYVVSEDIRTASGRRAVDSDDATARDLRGLSLTEVYEHAAAELDTSVSALQKQYGHLNAGMQRMNLGNRIRGALRARTS